MLSVPHLLYLDQISKELQILMKKIKHQVRLKTNRQKCSSFYRKMLRKHLYTISHHIQELEHFSDKKIILSLHEPDPVLMKICAILSQPCSSEASFFLLMKRYTRNFVMKFMQMCKKWSKMAAKLPMQKYLRLMEDMTLATVNPRWKYREQTLKNRIHLSINDYMGGGCAWSPGQSEWAELGEMEPILSVDEIINEVQFQIYSNID